MRGRRRGARIDRRLLGAGVRGAGGARHRRHAGQRAQRQERVGAQVGRAGLPMAAAAWATACSPPPSAPGGRLRLARRPAPARHPAAGAGPLRAADAEGAGADERPLANALTDIAGQTGLSIIRAIVAGGQELQALAKLRNYRVKASEADIAKSLEGTWKDEHLFCLGQALSLYDTHRQLIAEADAKLAALIAPLRRERAQAAGGKPKKRGGKNAPGFDAREALREWAGADLTQIGGIGVGTALKVLVDMGPDLSKFKSAKHFCSWLGLCPGTRISGGKRLSGASKRIPNRVARALKLAAQGLHHSQCGLGAHYRRMAARLGKATTATAHKPARLVYAMLTQGSEYVEQSQARYEARFQERTLKHLQQKAKSLGFDLVPVAV